MLAIIKSDGDSDLGKESVEPITDNFFSVGQDTSVFVFFSGIFSQKVPTRGRKTEYFITMALFISPLQIRLVILSIYSDIVLFFNI